MTVTNTTSRLDVSGMAQTVGAVAMGLRDFGPTQLAGIVAGDSLAEALRRRGSLAPGQSIITRSGEWVGKGWIRLSRGEDPHTGVIEREHRLKSLRADQSRSQDKVQGADADLITVRRAQTDAETERDQLQAAIQTSHREHSDARSRLEAARALAQELQSRRTRLENEAGEIARETGHAAPARSATSCNAAASSPSTLPVTFSTDAVIVGAPELSSNVTSAVTSR